MQVFCVAAFQIAVKVGRDDSGICFRGVSIIVTFSKVLCVSSRCCCCCCCLVLVVADIAVVLPDDSGFLPKAVDVLFDVVGVFVFLFLELFSMVMAFLLLLVVFLLMEQAFLLMLFAGL